MEFNKSYTQYWETSVQKSIDGTVIAGLQQVDHFLSPLGLRKNDHILDLGCSTGRMCVGLSRYSEAVYGVEPDSYAIGKATEQPYQEVRQGTAEATGYPNGFFDFVFCWAVFDVVDHFDGLSEINRILKDGGRFLITCKTDSYHPLDVLAFKAEKNAFLKGFPNRFTNLEQLFRQIEVLGFEITEFVAFPRRGDMGLLNYKRQNLLKPLSGHSIECYEYLMIAKKKSTCGRIKKNTNAPLDRQFSETGRTFAANAGYVSVEEYFVSIGID